jgi:hypothetical protein
MMLCFGLHDFLERKVRYFTFVRDPIARALSALHFVHARETHPAADYFASLQYRPSLLIADGNLLFSNDQVRIISGTSHFEVDASDLEQAKRNIEAHFAFVGNAAALVSCWPRLCELTGLKGDASVVRNKGQYSADLQLDDREMDLLARANAFDERLVAWVNEEYLPRHGIHLESTADANAGA